VQGDLIRILGNLMKRRDRFDYILIETTGLADPGPVAQTFFMAWVRRQVNGPTNHPIDAPAPFAISAGVLRRKTSARASSKTSICQTRLAATFAREEGSGC